jgi:nucleotide-binding universal stress UspA family protein
METSPQPRVVLGVDQSLAGYAALRTAVGIARSRHLSLFAVRAAPSVYPTEESYIEDAFAEALGGIPFDLDVQPTTMCDCASVALARVASDPRDLIVVGNDGRGMVRAAWSGSVGRTLFKYARCQILVVPAPAMHRATRRSARKLRGSRADVWDRFETEAPELRGRPFQGT